MLQSDNGSVKWMQNKYEEESLGEVRERETHQREGDEIERL